ncbi:uncharacterized protein LOC143531580 [Bidens hawaiensis]|uniref:uncharacterized protein LOC143531580 n=1 Tax=Bidens hawaiensis TaxID=980011 RepID=UPI00404B8DE9
MIIIILLAFKTPFRNPLVAKLDELKRGKAQLVIKSVGATVFVLLMYNIYSLSLIRRRSDPVNSPSDVIVAYHIFEAYLMGFSLIFLLAINTLHQYIKEVIVITETIRATKKQNQAYENCMKKSAHDADIKRQDIYKLQTEITNLESEYSEKDQTVKLLRADASEVKRILESGFEEYDQLLAYNKDLQEQLQSVNERLAQSSSTKSVFFSWDRWGL